MKIQQKRSSALDNGVAKKPTPAQTEYGELCVNFNESDPSLFIRDTNDEIRKIGGDLSLYQLKTEVGASVIISETKPIVDGNGDPVQSGELWYCSSTEDEGGGRLYVYYEDGNTSQWVDTSLPGSGADFGQSEAEELFLSKLNNDTAAGEITFEGRTTHEDGILATGGTGIRAIFDTTIPNWGGNQSAKFYASGNSNQTGNQGFAANDIGPGTSGDAVGFYYQENTANSTHNNYGFKANVLVNAGAGENYAFYSEGNASSYFGGVTEHGGGIKLPNITNAGTLGTDADGNIVVGSGTGAGDLWTEGAGGIYPTTVSNDVSIGTNSALAKLTVSGNTRIVGGGQLQLQPDSTVKWGITDSTNYAYIKGKDGDDGYLKLNVDGDHVTILKNGNVGIGTDAPSARLSISENSRSINLGVPVAGYATIEQNGSSNTALEVGGWGDVVIAADTNSVASKNIIFSRQGTQGSYTESMRITENGWVGINTDAPSSTLEVVGDSALKGAVWLSSHKNSFPGNGNNLPGCFVENAANGPSLHLSRPDNTPLFLNTGIDTAIVRFKKGGVEKGTISVNDDGASFNGRLDGISSGGFLRSDADDTGTGRITLTFGTGNQGNSTEGGKSAFEIKQDDNNADAFMAFHISGKFATYFGLDGNTNDLFVGGWSNGASRHRIAHSNNLDNFPIVRTDGLNQTVNGEKTFTGSTFFTNGITFHDQGLCIGTRNTASFPGVDNADTGGRLHHSPDSGCFVAVSRSNGEPLVTNRTGTNGNVISVRKNGAAKGGIEVNDSNIIITGQASDYRIKKDITPMPSALEQIKAMRLINFVYTDRGNGETHEGFIAHELQEIVPGAVTRHKDAVDEDGKPDLQGIDYSKLIPKLTKALQETIAKNEELEARLAALEGA